MKVSNQIVMNPRGIAATAMVAAASRAGARGFLNTAGYRSHTVIQSHARSVLSVTDNPIGIRLTPSSAEWITELTSSLTSQWQWAIVSQSDWSGWPRWVESLRRLGIEIIVEVDGPDEFEIPAALSADGVLLRGSEAGGRVADHSAFMLLQAWNQFCARSETENVPFWVQGGIGPNTASGCFIAGATGVVLDSQLLLCRESPLTADLRRIVAALDGSETRVVGQQLDQAWRLCPPRGSDLYDRLIEAEQALAATSPGASKAIERWDETVEQAAATSDFELFFTGQDIALAKSLADQFVTVSGVVQAICERSVSNIELADALKPIAAGSPLAESHQTEFPILQGPMTRVSDTAPFAADVAQGGALPFLALALMRGVDVERLMVETADRIPNRPWGVGLLGFLPPEIRREQTEVILKRKPPFAIIAGGRPDQANELEQLGIPTYLHVPSPGLLRRFLKDGARRFIFEGRECGGHVGPRSSFLLWETMVDVLLEHIGNGRGKDLHIVFAGGIHDATSAALVATLSAPLAERDVRIGVLMGTAYLFTQEAISSGAIVDRFQQEALSATETVLFETGPGHAVRCLRTPYYDDFVAEKSRLRKAGKSHDEVVKSLEMMNIGRLRVASKGLDRVATKKGVPRTLAAVSDRDQLERGMYMIGQVASLRGRPTTIADLHAEVSVSATEKIEDFADRLREESEDVSDPPNPCDVAIVGMACYYPGANSLGAYWENILRLQYDVTEVPGTHWDWRPFYDPNPRARDKIISKWGGFLGEIPFDPLRYGITPKSILSIEPLQLLLLECVRTALDDAGYDRRPFNRDRTCSILGVGGGGSPLAVAYGFRSCLPLLDNLETLGVSSSDILEQAQDFLPEWTEDSFPGFLLNVAVGRIANRFDFGGSNYAIDAACASSLAAVHACIRELEQGTADVAVAMGADTVQTPFAFMAFSKTHALSPQGRCRPFDAGADGIVLSEGIGAVILKRLEDAERDGDTIYAVVRGIGSSSDGKEKGLTAPNETGQVRALRRAYDKAGIAASRVGLVEAHGTGTVVGDRTEAAALASVLVESGAGAQSCALGSVKSLIGHSKCAAGIAGLIKTAKALHHRILPPTLVESPNPQVASDDSPLYLNRTPRPWIHEPSSPRVAGVSAFGFGGTNVHMVLEEYNDGLNSDGLSSDGLNIHGGEAAAPPMRDWPTEVFVWRGERSSVLAAVETQLDALQGPARPRLAEYAASLWRQAANVSAGSVAAGSDATGSEVTVLAIVAGNQDDLVERMKKAVGIVGGKEPRHSSPRGIYFSATSEPMGKVAFLFPGQGAQYPNMAAEVAMCFDEVRSAIDLVSGELGSRLETSLGQLIYPPSPFDDVQKKVAAKRLSQTNHAQPAIGAVSLGLLRLLRRLEVHADVVGGHSYGEFVALHAAGVISEEDVARLSLIRGELMRSAAEKTPGAMAAVAASHSAVAKVLSDVSGVTLANLNAPEQTVISASHDDLDAAIEKLSAAEIKVTRLDVACAFHSPAVAAACQPLAHEMDRLDFQPAKIPVYSNTTGAVHEADLKTVKRLMADHIGSPVRFVDEIQAMYDAGVRVFVEVGPQRHLSGLVRRILADQPHVTTATDVKDRSGISQIQHCVAALLCSGVPVDLKVLFERRVHRTFDPRRLAAETGVVEHSKNTWMVNGVRSRLWNTPEPKLLGQRWPNGEQETEPPVAKSPTVSTPNVSTLPGTAPALQTPTFKPAEPRSQTAKQPVAEKPPLNRAASSNQQPKSPIASPIEATPEASAMKKNQSAAPNRPASAPTNAEIGEVESVMLGFQDLMAKFLETQQAVMQQYLTGEAVDAPSPALPQSPSHPAVLRTAQTPPVPVELPSTEPATTESQFNTPSTSTRDDSPNAQLKTELKTEPESNLESNTTSAGTNGAAVSESKLSNEPPSNEPPSNSTCPNGTTQPSHSQFTTDSQSSTDLQMSMDEVHSNLVELVSERTGYPEDMLDPNLDLEADLGIDSIKRVEILGDLADVLGISDENNDSGIELEKLTTIRTLQGILDYLDETLYSATPPANGSAPQDSLTSPPSSPIPSSPVPSSPVPSSPTKVASNGATNGASNGETSDPTNGSSNGSSTATDRTGNGTAITGENGSPHNGGIAADAGNNEEASSPSSNGSTESVQRGLVQMIPAPMTTRGGMPIPAGPIVITDDGRGVAVELAERFADFGQTVVLLRSSDAAATESDGTFAADLSNEESVKGVLALIRSSVGPIAGFIHALPLSGNDGQNWLERARLDTKSFYLLCRELAPELVSSGEKGLAFVLAPTTLGGGLGFRAPSDPEDYLAGQGGVLGFAKCLAQESEGVLVRGVDFESHAERADICDALLAELADTKGPLEVGYQAGQRLTWTPVAGELDTTTKQIQLDSDSVVLLTGGARGITSAIAIEFAKRYQCHLVLIGRSPVPKAENESTIGLQSAADLKSALIARRKSDGADVVPAEIESEFNSILRDREIRSTISAIKKAGSKVTYDALDVRNEAAFATLIQKIRKHFGRLDGIIHGAGVIDDKLIRDKTPESFDRVFETKVQSAWNISQYVGGDDLQFCVFFASVASRYGNKGQSDYAAANEVLAKLAMDLDRRWPARVVAIDWGPWSEIGMVSDLERHLTARGVTLISPAEGTEHLLRELEFGAKGDTEVIIAGGAERLAVPQKVAESPS